MTNATAVLVSERCFEEHSFCGRWFAVVVERKDTFLCKGVFWILWGEGAQGGEPVFFFFFDEQVFFIMFRRHVSLTNPDAVMIYFVGTCEAVAASLVQR